MSAYDPTDIRNQERVKADSNLRNKLVKDTEEADLKWLMGSKRGRCIVWRLLDRAGVFRLSFEYQLNDDGVQRGDPERRPAHPGANPLALP